MRRSAAMPLARLLAVLLADRHASLAHAGTVTVSAPSYTVRETGPGAILLAEPATYTTSDTLTSIVAGPIVIDRTVATVANVAAITASHSMIGPICLPVARAQGPVNFATVAQCGGPATLAGGFQTTVTLVPTSTDNATVTAGGPFNSVSISLTSLIAGSQSFSSHPGDAPTPSQPAPYAGDGAYPRCYFIGCRPYERP
jgi:hypothetical protein